MIFEISHLTVIHMVANMIENHIYIDIVYRIYIYMYTFLDFIVPKKVYHNSVKFERRPLILLRSEDGILPPLREHVPPFNCSDEFSGDRQGCTPILTRAPVMGNHTSPISRGYLWVSPRIRWENTRTSYHGKVRAVR